MTMECLCPILERSTPVEDAGFSRDDWSLVRCTETGFVFLANPPDYAQLESEFAWESTVRDERQRRQEAAFVSAVSSFAKKLKRTIFPSRNKIASIALAALGSSRSRTEKAHVLDIGCGWGHNMLDIHQRCASAGREVVPSGIEISKYLAQVSLKRVAPLGGKVVSASAIDGIGDFEPNSIHLVVMSSFLEHEVRPLSLLRRVGAVLDDQGAVVLKVPNFACWNRYLRGGKWCGFRYPDHVNYFTPRTLRKLANEAGFRVHRQSLLDKFPLSDNMYAVLKKAIPQTPAATGDARQQVA